MKKSNNQPTDSIDLELKQAYRDIINKYKSFFGSDSKKLPVSDDEDISSALDIEIVEKDSKIIFPSTLTSQERKVVHEVCDEQGLQHKSYGEGTGRHVCVFFEEKRQKFNCKTESVKAIKADDPISIEDDICNRFVTMEIDDDIYGERVQIDTENDDVILQADCGKI